MNHSKLSFFRHLFSNYQSKNMKSKIFTLLIIAFSIISCQNSSTPENSEQTTNIQTKTIKDQKAAELVSKMVEKMGGQEKWEELQYVSWTFFGARHLVWDKKGNRVRIESPRDSSVYLVNLDELTGRYAYNGKETMDKEELSQKIKRGKSIWINDMYWVFMPFKLYDEGVSVKYLRTDTTMLGAPSDVLELSFENVGETPENKYEIHLTQEDTLIKQWDFYAEAKQEEASKKWPWDNYSTYNGLLLSSDRTDSSGPSNIRVYEHLDDKVFTSFENFTFY